MSKELEDILEIVKDLKKKPKWTQWLIPVLISAVVSLLVSGLGLYLQWQKQSTERWIEIAKMKWNIIEKSKTLDFIIAVAILEYPLKDLYNLDNEKELDNYQRFVKKYNEVASHYIVKSPSPPDAEQLDAAILPQQKEVVINAQVQNLVDKLDTSDRYAASRELIRRYTDMPNDITTALINSISPNNYRKNLYIAYTLAKIPDGWRGDTKKFKEICNLREEKDYDDETFKKRVDQAISNYKNDNNQSISCP